MGLCGHRPPAPRQTGSLGGSTPTRVPPGTPGGSLSSWPPSVRQAAGLAESVAQGSYNPHQTVHLVSSVAAASGAGAQAGHWPCSFLRSACWGLRLADGPAKPGQDHTSGGSRAGTGLPITHNSRLTNVFSLGLDRAKLLKCYALVELSSCHGLWEK